VLPMGDGDAREVLLFPHPGEGRGRFALVEDDGVSLAYQRGGYTTVEIVIVAAADGLALEVEVHGGYALPYATIDFVLPRGEQRPIRGAGIAAMWEADGQRRVRWTLS